MASRVRVLHSADQVQLGEVRPACHVLFMVSRVRGLSTADHVQLGGVLFCTCDAFVHCACYIYPLSIALFMQCAVPD